MELLETLTVSQTLAEIIDDGLVKGGFIGGEKDQGSGPVATEGEEEVTLALRQIGCRGRHAPLAFARHDLSLHPEDAGKEEDRDEEFEERQHRVSLPQQQVLPDEEEELPPDSGHSSRRIGRSPETKDSDRLSSTPFASSRVAKVRLLR